jgi:phage-related protein
MANTVTVKLSGDAESLIRVFAEASAAADASADDMKEKFAAASVELDVLSRNANGAGGSIKDLGDKARTAGDDISGMSDKNAAASDGMGMLMKTALATVPAILGIGQVAVAAGIGLVGAFASAGAGLAVFDLAAGAAKTSFETSASGILTAWQKTMQPFVTPVFTEALGAIKNGLADLTPVAKTVSGSLAGVAEQFKDSLDPSNFGSQFAAFGQQAGASISAFGSVLTNVIPTALNLFQAMSPLTTIVDQFLTKIGPELPSFASSLSGAFGGLANTFTEIGPQISSLFGSIAKVVGSLGGSLGEVAGPLLTLLSGLAKIVASGAGPVLQAIGGAIGDLLKAVTPLEKPLGAVVKALSGSFVTVVSELAGPLTAVAGALSGALAQALPPLAKLVGQLAVTFAKGLGQALREIAPDLRQLGPLLSQMFKAMEPLVPAVSGMFKAIEPLVPLLAKGFIGAVRDVVVPVTKFVGEVLKMKGLFGTSIGTDLLIGLVAIKGAMVGARLATEAWTVAQKIAKAATEAWTGVQAAFDAVMDANPIILIGLAVAGLGVAIYELVTHWKTVWGDIQKAAKDAWDFLDNDVLKPIQNAFSTVVDFIKQHWELIGAILIAPFDPFLAAFLVFHKQIIGFFEDLPGDIESAIGDLTSIGSKVMKDITNGIGNVVSAVDGWFGNVYSDIANAVGSIVGVGAKIITDITSGIGNVVGHVTSWFGGVLGDIGSAIGDVTSVGSKIIGDITKGVGTLATWAKNIFGGLGSDIKTGIGDLTGIGKSIIDDIISGINAGINAINSHIPSILGHKIFPSIPDIPLLAEGGIVTAPTFAMVGEGGYPEAVIPLKNGLSPAGFAQSVNSFMGGGQVTPYAPGGTATPATTKTGVGQVITVFAQTNANAQQIGQEVAWAAKTAPVFA